MASPESFISAVYRVGIAVGLRFDAVVNEKAEEATIEENKRTTSLQRGLAHYNTVRKYTRAVDFNEDMVFCGFNTESVCIARWLQDNPTHLLEELM